MLHIGDDSKEVNEPLLPTNPVTVTPTPTVPVAPVRVAPPLPEHAEILLESFWLECAPVASNNQQELDLCTIAPTHGPMLTCIYAGHASRKKISRKLIVVSAVGRM